MIQGRHLLLFRNQNYDSTAILSSRKRKCWTRLNVPTASVPPISAGGMNTEICQSYAASFQNVLYLLSMNVYEAEFQKEQPE
jgi:hypothetical protein